jgi:hypothetical protein
MVILLVLNSAASANWSGNGALAGYCWLMMRFFISRAIADTSPSFPVLFYDDVAGGQPTSAARPRYIASPLLRIACFNQA